MKKEAATKYKNILRPCSQLDVLLYYSIVAEKLKKYLKGKEIATKIWLPSGPMPNFLKRGSNNPPLYIEQFLKGADDYLLRARKEFESLGNAQKKAPKKLTKEQINAWNYFVPRKLIDFFYATNNEGIGKPIERIFIDIDRKGISEDSARMAAKELADIIKKDKELAKIIKFKLFVMWTGNSFHVYLMLKKPVSHSVYDKYFRYSKDEPAKGFPGKWAELTRKKTGIKIYGGHEKIQNGINIDPSQTPSGKLCRCPFSLHMKDASTIDGIALPVSIKELSDKGLVKRLKSYTPEKVVKELDKLAKLLP